ncbi:DUF4349 domain-containing protein [Aureicoccus marinus]|uniref:DUF4349 domain-containing protein n=1 Tax=Aureicoccus marinus TaxID=754435 RepID=UPI000CF3DA46|nr:DUF4349 domain-containing protein [Aureicoccus marinus]
MQYIQSFTIAIGISLLALACGGGSSEGVPNSEISMVEEFKAPSNSPVQETDQVVQSERMLIRNGRLEFETENLEATSQQIQSAVKKYQGYMGSEQSYNTERRQSTTVNVRIPSRSFDGFIEDISGGVEQFDVKDISARDVTEEFLDVEARMKNKKELEARYQEILKKAQNVKEILEIEREINSLRSDIESMEGRLNYLKNQVSLSSIQITYYKETPKVTAFGKEFSNGFRSGWRNLVWFLVGLVNIWPFLLLSGFAILIIRKQITRIKSKNS